MVPSLLLLASEESGRSAFLGGVEQVDINKHDALFPVHDARFIPLYKQQVTLVV